MLLTTNRKRTCILYPVRLCSAHTALRPIGVKNLMCFDAFETQHLIGQITKGANRPPVTTYSGIAVLTLI